MKKIGEMEVSFSEKSTVCPERDKIALTSYGIEEDQTRKSLNFNSSNSELKSTEINNANNGACKRSSSCNNNINTAVETQEKNNEEIATRSRSRNSKIYQDVEEALSSLLWQPYEYQKKEDTSISSPENYSYDYYDSSSSSSYSSGSNSYWNGNYNNCNYNLNTIGSNYNYGYWCNNYSAGTTFIRGNIGLNTLRTPKNVYQPNYKVLEKQNYHQTVNREREESCKYLNFTNSSNERLNYNLQNNSSNVEISHQQIGKCHVKKINNDYQRIKINKNKNTINSDSTQTYHLEKSKCKSAVSLNNNGNNDDSGYESLNCKLEIEGSIQDSGSSYNVLNKSSSICADANGACNKSSMNEICLLESLDLNDFSLEEEFIAENGRFVTENGKFIAEKGSKFVNENGKFVNKNSKFIAENVDGKFVSENGKFIAENVARKFVFENGKFVNINGKFFAENDSKFVNENGRKIVIENDKFLTENGSKFVAENGKFLTENGCKFVAENGSKFANENGKFLTENGSKFVAENGQIFTENGCKFVAENGSKFANENGSKFVNENGKFLTENGSKFVAEKSCKFVVENGCKFANEKGSKFVNENCKFLSENGSQFVAENSSKFANENGSKFANENGSKFVNENGKFLTENGSKFVAEKGCKFVIENGCKFANEKGSKFVNENGKFLTENGSQFVAENSSKFANENGSKFVNKNGKFVSENGKFTAATFISEEINCRSEKFLQRNIVDVDGKLTSVSCCEDDSSCGGELLHAVRRDLGGMEEAHAFAEEEERGAAEELNGARGSSSLVVNNLWSPSLEPRDRLSECTGSGIGSLPECAECVASRCDAFEMRVQVKEAHHHPDLGGLSQANIVGLPQGNHARHHSTPATNNAPPRMENVPFRFNAAVNQEQRTPPQQDNASATTASYFRFNASVNQEKINCANIVPTTYTQQRQQHPNLPINHLRSASAPSQAKTGATYRTSLPSSSEQPNTTYKPSSYNSGIPVRNLTTTTATNPNQSPARLSYNTPQASPATKTLNKNAEDKKQKKKQQQSDKLAKNDINNKKQASTSTNSASASASSSSSASKTAALSSKKGEKNAREKESSKDKDKLKKQQKQQRSVGPDTRVLEMRVQNLDPRVQILDSKVQSLDSRVQNLDSQVQTLDFRVQNAQQVTGGGGNAERSHAESTGAVNSAEKQCNNIDNKLRYQSARYSTTNQSQNVDSGARYQSVDTQNSGSRYQAVNLTTSSNEANISSNLRHQPSLNETQTHDDANDQKPIQNKQIPQQQQQQQLVGKFQASELPGMQNNCCSVPNDPKRNNVYVFNNANNGNKNVQQVMVQNGQKQQQQQQQQFGHLYNNQAQSQGNVFNQGSLVVKNLSSPQARQLINANSPPSYFQGLQYSQHNPQILHLHQQSQQQISQYNQQISQLTQQISQKNQLISQQNQIISQQNQVLSQTQPINLSLKPQSPSQQQQNSGFQNSVQSQSTSTGYHQNQQIVQYGGVQNGYQNVQNNPQNIPSTSLPHGIQNSYHQNVLNNHQNVLINQQNMHQGTQNVAPHLSGHQSIQTGLQNVHQNSQNVHQNSLHNVNPNVQTGLQLNQNSTQQISSQNLGVHQNLSQVQQFNQQSVKNGYFYQQQYQHQHQHQQALQNVKNSPNRAFVNQGMQYVQSSTPQQQNYGYQNPQFLPKSQAASCSSGQQQAPWLPEKQEQSQSLSHAFASSNNGTSCVSPQKESEETAMLQNAKLQQQQSPLDNNKIPTANVSSVNVNYYRAVPVNVVSPTPTLSVNSEAGSEENVFNVQLIQNEEQPNNDNNNLVKIEDDLLKIENKTIENEKENEKEVQVKLCENTIPDSIRFKSVSEGNVNLLIEQEAINKNSKEVEDVKCEERRESADIAVVPILKQCSSTVNILQNDVSPPSSSSSLETSGLGRKSLSVPNVGLIDDVLKPALSTLTLTEVVVHNSDENTNFLQQIAEENNQELLLANVQFVNNALNQQQNSCGDFMTTCSSGNENIHQTNQNQNQILGFSAGEMTNFQYIQTQQSTSTSNGNNHPIFIQTFASTGTGGMVANANLNQISNVQSILSSQSIQCNAQTGQCLIQSVPRLQPVEVQGSSNSNSQSNSASVEVRTRTFASTEAQTDDTCNVINQSSSANDGGQIQGQGLSREQRRRERRERRHQRRVNGSNHRHSGASAGCEQLSGGQNERLPDILNSHLPPPYSPVPGGLGPPPPPAPMALVPPMVGAIVPSGVVPGGVVGPPIVPFPGPVVPGQVPLMPPQGPVPVPVPAPSGFRFGFPASGAFRRGRYSEEPPKSCCGLLAWKPGSLRWFIAMIALVAVCCVLVGTALGAMRPSGRDHLTVSLLMIGVGVVLVTVSGVAWRLTSHDSPTCRSMLGLGSTESVDVCSRRFVPRLPPSYGRPHHPYAAMMYPEFQYRPPPPSYQASMQEYRLRLLLLDRGNTPQIQAGLQNAVSPPPTYRSHAGSLLRAPLSSRREASQSEYSCPPSYRSQNSSTRPPAITLPNNSVIHSREQSITLSDSNTGGSVVNVVNILSNNEDDIALDNITLDSLKMEPESELNPLKMLLKGSTTDLENTSKEGNLVTIVQTNDQSPVIVTVSGSSHADLGSSVQITEIPSEMEILAHL